MKIIRLSSSNVKRLVAVDIQPDGSLVVIGGKNGAGKSSVLDSIMYALAGKGSIPAEPVRKGQRRAKVVVDLEGGLRVTRSFDAAGGSKLVVEDKGAEQKSPQAMLDKLCGQLCFDPLEYSRLKPQAQAEVLRKLVGVDTAELDQRRSDIYARRTEAGREAKRLQAQLDALPAPVAGVPATEVSIADLTDELARRQEQQRANDAVAQAATDAARKSAEAARAVEDDEAEVQRLERILAEALEALEHSRQEALSAQQQAQRARAAADALVAPDLAEVREQLRTVEQTNRQVRANQQRAKLQRSVVDADAQVDRLSDEIQAIDDEKHERIAGAQFPIPGLSLGIDGVELDGVPLEQASQAQRLRVSVAMGFALNPELRVLLVRDGSLLDEESMRLVAEMAEQADGQLWLERVSSTGEGCSVVIEDGQVRGSVGHGEAA